LNTEQVCTRKKPCSLWQGLLHILKTVSENINIKIGDIELESKVLTLKKVDTEVVSILIL
jgi:hypothetical protein